MRKSTLYRITIVVVAVGLSQPLREADDGIVSERRSDRAHGTRKDADSQPAREAANYAYLAAKNPWLQRQFRAALGFSDLPFIVGRRPVAEEGLSASARAPILRTNKTIERRAHRIRHRR